MAKRKRGERKGPGRKPVTPAEYLPFAEEMIRRRDELDLGDDDVAERDQRDAAARDSRRNVRKVAGLIREKGVNPEVFRLEGARRLAWGLAVSGTIERKIPQDRRCPHAKPEANLPLMLMLTPRLLFCRACGSQYLGRVNEIVDSDHCDVCDRRSKVFSEFVGTLGPIQFFANICDSCREFAEAQD